MSSNYRLQLIFYPTFTWEWIEESGDDTYLSPSSEQGTPILIFRPKNISSADVDLNIDFKTLRECRYQFLWDGDMLKNHFSGRRFGTRPLLNRSNRHLGGNSLFYRSFLITAMYMVNVGPKMGCFLGQLVTWTKHPCNTFYQSKSGADFLQKLALAL